MKRALVTGITGQDGSYLAELLLEKGYAVSGLVRRTSSATFPRIAHLGDRVRLVEGDVLDQGSLWRAVEESEPDEVYHLAAQSYVGRSWREPVHTIEVAGLGAVRMLDAVRTVAPRARFYQASTSEMFGAASPPLGPDGPFLPRSPYGMAKVLAHHAARNWRESYGMFVSRGILFNHESPRRGPEFVTRKVAAAAAAAADGRLREPLRLGTLDARRDWGWAPDFVDAMWRMLQTDAPVDLVIGTGVSHTVGELVAAAFGTVGMPWEPHVVVDPALARPADVHVLVADPSEAARVIAWTPTVGFDEMVARMVAAERAP